MRRKSSFLILFPIFLVLIIFLNLGCGKDDSGTSDPNSFREIALTPGTDSEFQIRQMTVFFPGDSVKKSVTCIAEVINYKPSLPENLTPVTDIYSLSLSDPEVYEPDNEGNVAFIVQNPLEYSVFASFEKYDKNIKSGDIPWYNIGGTVKDNEIVAPIPKGVCQFVVAREKGNDEVRASDSHMRKGPFLLLNGSVDSMTVQWEAASACKDKATLSWGDKHHDDPDDYPNHEEVTADKNLFFSKQISDLKKSKRYYYCVTLVKSDDNSKWNYQGSFLAPPSEEDKKLTFYAYGDTRSFPADHNRVLHYLYADSQANGLQDTRQTFLIHAGDFCSRGLQEDKWDGEFFYYRKHKSTNTVLATFPLMGAVGNHEHYLDVKKHCTYQDIAALYRYYWNYPMYQTEDNCYYSFDYGPVHVASLDVYSAEYSTGSAQNEWLKEDLLASDKPWKIVVFHHPAYCANKPGHDNGYANTDDIRQYLCPILEDRKYGVNLVIQAHEHNYSRCIVNDMNYVMLGGGGAGLSKINDASASYVVCAEKQYCFARIEIDHSSMQVTVLNANDDSYMEKIDYVKIIK